MLVLSKNTQQNPSVATISKAEKKELSMALHLISSLFISNCSSTCCSFLLWFSTSPQDSFILHYNKKQPFLCKKNLILKGKIIAEFITLSKMLSNEIQYLHKHELGISKFRDFQDKSIICFMLPRSNN